MVLFAGLFRKSGCCVCCRAEEQLPGDERGAAHSARCAANDQLSGEFLPAPGPVAVHLSAPACLPTLLEMPLLHAALLHAVSADARLLTLNLHV